MKALVTRPKDDAAAVATELRVRGIEPVSAPMLRVELEPAAARLCGALAGVQAVLFTSANAVRAFAHASDRFELPAYCVGEATAAAARIAGFRTVASADGDVRDLIVMVASRLAPGNGALLHAAGHTTAGNLGVDLATRGFSVRRVELYRAVTADDLPSDVAAAMGRDEVKLALFFSPRTAETFVRLARRAGLTEHCAAMTAVCLSQEVAAALSGTPWHAVVTARMPNLAALLAALDEIVRA